MTNDEQRIQKLAVRQTDSRTRMEAAGYGFMSIMTSTHPDGGFFVISCMIQTPDSGVPASMMVGVDKALLDDERALAEKCDVAAVAMQEGIFKHTAPMQVEEVKPNDA